MEQTNLFGESETPKKETSQRTVRDLTKEKSRIIKNQAIEERQELEEEKTSILNRLLTGQNYYPDPEDLQSAWIAGRGGKGSKCKDGKIVKIALVGFQPNKADIRNKPQPKVLTGKGGELLEKTLDYCTGKYKAKELYMTNLIKYYKDEKSKISTVEKEFGLEILLEELKHVKADYIICLGTEVFNALIRNTHTYSAGKFRGVFLDKKHCKANIPTAGIQNPNQIIRPEGIKNKKSFQEDLVALIKQIKSGETQSLNVPYTQIETIDEVQQWYKDLSKFSEKCKKENKKVLMSLDTETEVEKIDGNLYPTGVFIISTTFTHTKATSVKELHNHIWALKITPEWKEITREDIEFQSDLGLGIEDIYDNLDDSELSNYEKPTKYFVIDPSEPEKEKNQKIQLERWVKKSDSHIAKVLNTEEIHDTELNTKSGKFRVKITIENAIRKFVDQFVMMNASFDKSAMEHSFNFDWECLTENSINKNRELMMSCHLLDENNLKSLKAQASKQLGWRNYDLPLELVKAEYGISNYLLIPYSICAPYAALDSAATALCEIKNVELSDRKWFSRLGVIDDYYNNLEIITKKPLSDTSRDTTRALRAKINELMPVLFRLKNKGMPVGKEGRKKAGQLTQFYRGNYTKMALEVNQKLNKVSPKISQMDPSSNAQVAAILFSEKSKGGLGLTPFKSAGKDGKLWNRLKPSETRTATGATDAESMNYVLKELEKKLPKDIQNAIKNANLPKEREEIYKECEETHQYGFVRRLFECRRIQNLYNNFATDKEDSGFFARIGSDDRLHTDYTPNLETLRFRSKPNLANAPKSESKWVYPLIGEKPPCDIRNIVRANPGSTLLTRDWSTAEVFMLMYRSGDTNGLSVIEEGLDFHLLVGLQTNELLQKAKEKWEKKDISLLAEIKAYISFGKSGEELDKCMKMFHNYLTPLFHSTKKKDMFDLLKVSFKNIRDGIKPTTFGVPYGETAEGLARQSGKTPAEAQLDIDGYKNAYPQAIKYLDYQAEFAKINGYLPTPCGYVRNFPYGMNKGDLERKAYNLQIQHGVGMMMIDAMIDWDKKRQKYNLKSELFMTLYDALGWEVKNEEISTIAEISHEVMTTERPVGPMDNRTIPTEGEFIEFWEGEKLEEHLYPEFSL